MSYKQIIPSFFFPLCYTVGSHELSILYIVLYIYVNPNFPIYATLFPPFGVHMFILYVCVPICALQIGSSVLDF